MNSTMTAVPRKRDPDALAITSDLQMKRNQLRHLSSAYEMLESMRRKVT